ncbi:MAG TPA: hypothetical protein VFY45_19395 [Baekduia sp.]|nr:hypothetical protein [Baekduia sp.]
MRSMQKMCGIVGLVAAMGALGGGASASAATIGPAGTAFTGANSSGSEQVIGFSGSIKLRCNQVRYSGTTPSPATSSTPFAAAYGSATGVAGAWCRLYNGVNFTTVTVATSGSWTLSANTFDALTGTSTGTVTTGGATTLTTSIGSCVITLPSGTVLGAAGENWVGGGLTETLSQSHIAFTATSLCAAWGIPTSGSYATASGAVDFSGLSVS